MFFLAAELAPDGAQTVLAAEKHVTFVEKTWTYRLVFWFVRRLRSRLGQSHSKSGISLVAPRQLALALQSLPPMLHKL
jgi:hypothetical protein